jgi:hypothetical protein
MQAMSIQLGYTSSIVLHCSTTSERALQDDQRSFLLIERQPAYLISEEISSGASEHWV